MTLPTRALGTSGLTVSAQGLGCMGMSFAYGPPDETSRPPRSTARSTSASPSSTPPTSTASAHNEKLVGKAIAGRPRRGRAGHQVRHRLTRTTPDRGVDGDPAYVRQACDASLGRLGVDHIDLYYQHRPDTDRAHRGDRRRHGRAGAGRQGPPPRPVRGVGRHDPPGRRRPPDRRPAERVVAVHPRPRGRRRARLPRARHRPGAVQPARPGDAHRRRHQPRRSSPTTTSAAPTPASRATTSTTTWRSSRSCRRSPRPTACTPGQVALAWLSAQGDDVVPIPGTKRRTYLEENVGAARRQADRRRPRPPGRARSRRRPLVPANWTNLDTPVA